MDKKDLEKLLEEENNPLNFFMDINTILKYITTYAEFFDLVNKFLNDSEKLALFKFPYFQKWEQGQKVNLLMLISDEEILLQGLKDESIIKDISSWNIIKIIKNKSDDLKIKILYTESIAKKLSGFDIVEIIESLGTAGKYTILSDKQLIDEKIQLGRFNLVSLIKKSKFEDDKKQQLIDLYQLSEYDMVDIVKTYCNENKEKALLEHPNLNKYQIVDILKSFDPSYLIDFINRHKTGFLKDIKVYEIIKELDIEQQLLIVSDLDKLNLTEQERKEIIVTLKKDTKQKIDISKLPDSLKKIISFETEEYTGLIILDLTRDLEDYRELDSLLSVNPSRFTKEERDKFLQLCDICPNLIVKSTLDSKEDGGIIYSSSTQEYKIAEEWVNEVINSLKKEYTVLQKIAIIDNAIGKRISYSPDFDTEIFSKSKCRSLYKIISSGYGVCNGIARVEQYILERIGIDCEIVGSRNHAFIKLNNVEFELENGEKTIGTTILDPTWNLVAHRFGGKPSNFCISYEEARKADIDSNGIDHKCHLNDEKLQDATFSLDEKSLRKLFKSIGLADDNGDFPIKHLIDQSKQLHRRYASQPEKDIEEQFSLLSDVCPEFVTCQNSTMAILKDILLDNEDYKFNKCVVNRVYNRSDDSKRPVMYVYIKSDELGERFYYADKQRGTFINLSKDEFLSLFECYEKDLQKNNGIRPWEESIQEEKKTNLETSSGKIVVYNEEDRQ